jgi:plastocyanin
MRYAPLVLSIIALSSMPGTAAATDPASEVIIAFGQQRFDPAMVEVRRGVRVTFHNLSTSEVLTIADAAGRFESWPLGEHGEWTHVFSEPGHYEFFVKEHPEVRGVAEIR